MTIEQNIMKATRPDGGSTGGYDVLSWQQKGIGITRIAFGVAWAVAAILKWQPAFISSFTDTVNGALNGQPAFIQAWISLWARLVSINPHMFAYGAALVETSLAICFLLGIFTNTASVVGILWAFIVWSVPEGFGGPYVPGQSTDIGTTFPYMLLCLFLLCVASGRYFGLDRMLTPRLGRFGFLATGPLWRKTL